MPIGHPHRQTHEDPPLSQRANFHGSGAIAFSTKGEYGVRLMVQLGRHFGTGPASLSEIAAAESLPRAYLEQLVMSLRDAGLVVSTRGAHGGYELTRPPAQIRMSQVVRALEGPIAPMICATDDPEHAITCDRSALCTVNIMWVRVRDAISGALEAMTLADLVPLRLLAVGPSQREGSAQGLTRRPHGPSGVPIAQPVDPATTPIAKPTASPGAVTVS